ncbi:hypothetical protein KACHI17_19200 [Sediminibacterium sp. KACHI17]|uniref:Methyltransferase domain-containing protein n=1 Tax=Sediminibacterium sp. KACHI17 TaxID=1751071 RepID=A0AAT9GKB9_9BACT
MDLKKGDPVKVFTHQYPTWLLKHPRWIHLIYTFNYLIQLRKWYLTSRLQKMLAARAHSFNLLDAGCGEGQFLLPYVASYKDAHFKGIDRADSNISFCNSYAQVNGYANAVFEQKELESLQETEVYDIVLCISVLPYCKDDHAALYALYTALKKDGELLLYVPVNNTSILPFYRTILNTYENYERIQNNQRVYTKYRVLELLDSNGFRISDMTLTYGFFGKISNELYNTHLILFNACSLPLKIILSVSLLLFYPLILLCMILDFILPVTSGNGLMIVAKK